MSVGSNKAEAAAKVANENARGRTGKQNRTKRNLEVAGGEAKG